MNSFLIYSLCNLRQLFEKMIENGVKSILTAGPAEDYSRSFMKMIKRGIDSTNWPLKKKIWLKIQIVGEWKGLSKLFWMEASIRGPCQLCCWESCWSLRPFFLFHQRCTHIWNCNVFFLEKRRRKTFYSLQQVLFTGLIKSPPGKCVQQTSQVGGALLQRGGAGKGGKEVIER